MGGLVATQWLPFVVGHEIWPHIFLRLQTGGVWSTSLTRITWTLVADSALPGPPPQCALLIRQESLTWTDGTFAPNAVFALLFHFSARWQSPGPRSTIAFSSPHISVRSLLHAFARRQKLTGTLIPVACSSKWLLSAHCGTCAQSEHNPRKSHGVSLVSALCPMKRLSFMFCIRLTSVSCVICAFR